MSDTISFNETNPRENRIFHIRGLPVMLDSDLAILFGVSVKRMNEQVKRNQTRFPFPFVFRLNEGEWQILRSQFATSSQQHGGRRYLPHVFSEYGVVMLASVLNSETAIRLSIQITNIFIHWRKSFSSINLLTLRVDSLENKQFEFDKKIDQVFSALEQSDPIPQQGIFFNGQIFDAYKFASDLIKKAKQSIILIDNYIDESTLALLSKRNKNVEATIYSEKLNSTFKADLSKFNQQYPPIKFEVLKNNHDRFIIIDHEELYHIGASLKDLGKKLFAFSRMDAEVGRLLKLLE